MAAPGRQRSVQFTSVNSDGKTFKNLIGQSPPLDLALDLAGRHLAVAWMDGRVDVLDLTAIVEAFRHLPTAPGQESSDLWPCTPDGVIDVLDMTMVADAFQGYSYWDSTGCPVPCP